MAELIIAHPFLSCLGSLWLGAALGFFAAALLAAGRDDNADLHRRILQLDTAAPEMTDALARAIVLLRMRARQTGHERDLLLDRVDERASSNRVPARRPESKLQH